MRLSIFPAANPHPRNKDEKRVEAFKFSAPHLPEVRDFFTEDELIELVTNNCWSPFVFSGQRHADNFVSCDLLVYDIDEGLTIDEAKSKVEKLGLACLCLPSPSHTDEAHRFRLIMPLSRTIYSEEIYAATWSTGAEIFGTVDQQTKDLARAFFGCTMTDGFWNEGELFEPVEATEKEEIGTEAHSNTLLLPVSEDINEIVKSIYGEDRKYVPEAVDFFVRNAHTGISGGWINALNRFCFSLALSGVGESTILSVCNELAPSELDKKDMYQIKRAIKDAEKEL
jgi:hypothetical protein